MSEAISVSENRELQQAVEQELNWDPSVAPASGGVAAQDHAVTLSGRVRQHGNHLAALRAAKRVSGVHVVADEFVGESDGATNHTDLDIAEYEEHADVALRGSSLGARERS
jgi:hypothetical protein